MGGGCFVRNKMVEQSSRRSACASGARTCFVYRPKVSSVAIEACSALNHLTHIFESKTYADSEDRRT
jgi:hypothetical protein